MKKLKHWIQVNLKHLYIFKAVYETLFQDIF